MENLMPCSLTFAARLVCCIPLLLGSVLALAQAPKPTAAVQVGQRPFFLGDNMADGALKTKLKSCGNGPFSATNFSIGHRGAPLLFSEHTQESYILATPLAAKCTKPFTPFDEVNNKPASAECRTSDISSATVTYYANRMGLK
jgi:glycerophosphoryl diester phosphodiesterase